MASLYYFLLHYTVHRKYKELSCICFTYVYMICMPKAQGQQARGLRAYISGKSRVPILQLICNTFLTSCAQAKSSVALQQLYL